VIPASVREEISEYLGSQARRYAIPSLQGDRQTGCECWDLPPLKEEDKPLHLRYQEISSRIMILLEADKNDPRIEPLSQQANEMIKGLHVTKRHGIPVVTIHQLLSLDRSMGIRKEWWELRTRFVEQGVSIFQGYEAGMAGNANILIGMPSPDPYDFLRLHGTRGNNGPVDTERIIAALKKLDAEYGVGIVSAAEDSVEFVFERPVDAPSRARIRQRLSRLCPSAEALSEGIRLGRVTLWWD
jgi:hypothetical protein